MFLCLLHYKQFDSYVILIFIKAILFFASVSPGLMLCYTSFRECGVDNSHVAKFTKIISCFV